MLSKVLGDPDSDWSMTQLAEELSASPSTIGREVERAAQAGLVEVREVGRTKLVAANINSEYFEPLSQLLLIGFGPKQRITDALAVIKGVEEAYLVGSWAERYRGVPGPPPNDIDVLVIGDANRAAIYDAIEPLERELRRPIQVTFRTRKEWESDDDPFVATVRSRELVALITHEVSP
ncbi:ArsR family transcriptional regulator [soil metagenome]